MSIYITNTYLGHAFIKEVLGPRLGNLDHGVRCNLSRLLLQKLAWSVMMINGAECSHLKLRGFHNRDSFSEELGFQRSIGKQKLVVALTWWHWQPASSTPAAGPYLQPLYPTSTQVILLWPERRLLGLLPGHASLSSILPVPPAREPGPVLPHCGRAQVGRDPRLRADLQGYLFAFPGRRLHRAWLAEGLPGHWSWCEAGSPSQRRTECHQPQEWQGWFSLLDTGSCQQVGKAGGEGKKKGNIMSVINSEQSIFSKKPKASLERQNWFPLKFHLC